MNDIVNGIELYDLTNSVIQKYRTEAKQSKNIDIEILRRKLTSMILNAYSKKIESDHDIKYKFGGCYLHVNEPYKLITDIGWYDEMHSSYRIPKMIIEQFIETNLKLGLNKKGSNYINI